MIDRLEEDGLAEEAGDVGLDDRGGVGVAGASWSWKESSGESSSKLGMGEPALGAYNQSSEWWDEINDTLLSERVS